MDRREFLQGVALATAASMSEAAANGEEAAEDTDALVAQFTLDGEGWKVYEDLKNREGSITFVSQKGARRVMTKSAEATWAEADPPFLGLNPADIGMSGADLLADKLLEHGDPDEQQVKAAAPPLGSGGANGGAGNASGGQGRWTAIVGTKECSDTQPVFPLGNTRTYHPSQYFSELRTPIGPPGAQNSPAAARKKFDGMLGGWMPAIRKVVPISASAYMEMIVFGDVEAHDKYIVQTWHRTAQIEDGKIRKVVYGYSYPAFPPAREDPKPEEFYRALLKFAEYWDKQVHDLAKHSLPDQSWVDFGRHAFAKEIMVRPGGVYPKYGAVDRDYYGSEYDGFQDIFTSAVYTNLEWGRFESARAIIDNYYSDFVDAHGVCNMRGPETAQFGLTLALLAKYARYTGDRTLILKHRAKIEATARVLTDMHDISLKLDRSNAGYGLIHGWSESDACLANEPATWWQPYFSNSAFAARGLKDIAGVWANIDAKLAGEWMRRSQTLKDATSAGISANVRREMKPPYIGPLPGSKLTFRESMAQERPSPQQWPHRPYAELLQADMLPEELANTVIDCMRAYGATTLGVVANVGRPRPGGRAILGFISYGYAQMLLRLDRVEEFLLFLYSHRYHDHTRGTWTAGEVAGIGGGTAIFCIPAQQTIPMLLRWMLVLEDSDEDRLYFSKGVPRDWMASGKPMRIEQAPTRWGRVNFSLTGSAKGATATVELGRSVAPKEIQVKLRPPAGRRLSGATVGGRAASIGGAHQDMVIIQTGSQRRFEIAGTFA